MGAFFDARTDLWTYESIYAKFNEDMTKVRFKKDGRWYTRMLWMERPYSIGFRFRGDFYKISVSEYNRLANKEMIS